MPAPIVMKFYALLAWIAGELTFLRSQDYGMYLNWNAYETDWW